MTLPGLSAAPLLMGSEKTKYGFISAAVGRSATPTTTITTNCPAGVRDGDLLIAIICVDNIDSEPTSYPLGWDVVSAAASAGGAGSGRMAILKRVASSEPSSYQSVWSGSNGGRMWIIAFRGMTSVGTVGTLSPNVSPLSAPGITATSGRMLLACFYTQYYSGTLSVTPPAGMVQFDVETPSGWSSLFPAQTIFGLEPTTAGATGAKTLNLGPGSYGPAASRLLEIIP